MQLLPEQGQRVLIVGQTGSGKTAFACWMMKLIKQAPIVIYDTKEESKFLALKPSIVVTDFDGVMNAYNEGLHDYIIVRPEPSMSSEPQELDELLYQHYMELRGIPAYIDEIFSFHTTTGRSFKGLMTLLTRGRSRGITTIMSSQRPAFLSKFAMTEAQKMYIFFLGYEQDTKRVAEFVPSIVDKPALKPKEHKFYYYDVEEASLTLFKPVKLDKEFASGYIDEIVVAEPDAERSRKFLWS